RYTLVPPVHMYLSPLIVHSFILSVAVHHLHLHSFPTRRSSDLIEKPRGWRLREGESVSVDGVCSTVQKSNAHAFKVVYMPETLRRTTLGGLKARDRVNLERCLSLSSLIGGHLVLGHVDATARIARVHPEGDAKIHTFEIPRPLSRYIVEKGSIAVDGVSLTVVSSKPGQFTASLLSFTLRLTTL